MLIILARLKIYRNPQNIIRQSLEQTFVNMMGENNKDGFETLDSVDLFLFKVLIEKKKKADFPS